MPYRSEKVTKIQQSPVVELQEAKLFVKEDREINDSLIESLIRAATTKLQSYTDTIFEKSSYKLTTDKFEPINIPQKPLDESTIQITYKDENGSSQTLDDSKYDLYRNRLTFDTDKGSDIEITFDAGYTDQTIPHQLKTAIKLLVMVYYQRYLTGEDGKEVNPMNHSMIRDMFMNFKNKHF